VALVGVVGGIASGKSLVTGQLESLGAGVIDADRLDHEALRLPDVKEKLRSRFGDSVFDRDNEISRAAVAKLVFGDAPEARENLSDLEKITHPTIAELAESRMRELADAGTRVVVLDAAVMIEAGWDRQCDRVIYVDAPRATRLARARSRGWSAEEFAHREAAQESLDVKRSRSDTVIDNSGTPQETLNQLQRFWHTLTQKP